MESFKERQKRRRGRASDLSYKYILDDDEYFYDEECESYTQRKHRHRKSSSSSHRRPPRNTQKRVSSSSHSTKNAALKDDFLPREEHSFKEYAVYNNLDLGTQLKLVFCTSEKYEQLQRPENKIQVPECETSLNSRIAGFKEKLPKTRFVLEHERELLGVQSERSAKSSSSSIASSLPYHHYCEPSESQLAALVEYDMDDEDFAWLDHLNEQRRRDGLRVIEPLFFETVIDRLEKEWYDLVQPIQRTLHDDEHATLPDDLKCDICGQSDTSNSNVIVLCDGCDVPVHQECYGVPFVPEGPWLCRRCMISPETAVNCVLCPNRGGALKQTTVTGQWTHSVCAHWIAETYPLNDTYQEPIAGVENILQARWKLFCCVCGKRSGAAIQCESRSCKLAFHATCAKKNNFTMDYNSRIAYCGKHSVAQDAEILAQDSHAKPDIPFSPPKSVRNFNNIVFDEESDPAISEFPNSNSTNAHDEAGVMAPGSDAEIDITGVEAPKNLTNGTLEIATSPKIIQFSTTQTEPPSTSPKIKKKIPQIVNQYIFNRLLDYLSEFEHVRQQKKVLLSICRYWSLKRESRKGVPLLKRLQLEASSVSLASPDIKRDAEWEATCSARFSEMAYLKKDVSRLRLMIELVRLRERERKKYLAIQKEIFFITTRSLYFYLNQLMFLLAELDPKQIFSQPVDLAAVPSYTSVIKNPMDFQTMQSKIDEMTYRSFEEWLIDFTLVYENAMLFNKPSTIYYKAAVNIKEKSQTAIETVQYLLSKNNCTFQKVADIKSYPEEEEVLSHEISTKIELIQSPPSLAPISPVNTTDDVIDIETLETHASIESFKIPKKQPKTATFTKFLPKSAPERPTRETRTRSMPTSPVPDCKANEKTIKIQKSAPKASTPKRSASEPPQRSVKLPDAQLHNLVWAKVGGHPFYPAIVVSPGDKLHKEIPDMLLDKKKTSKLECKIVRFFDKGSSWSIVPAHIGIRPFNFDYEKDMALFNPKAKSYQQAPIREAYEKATMWATSHKKRTSASRQATIAELFNWKKEGNNKAPTKK